VEKKSGEFVWSGKKGREASSERKEGRYHHANQKGVHATSKMKRRAFAGKVGGRFLGGEKDPYRLIILEKQEKEALTSGVKGAASLTVIEGERVSLPSWGRRKRPSSPPQISRREKFIFPLQREKREKALLVIMSLN